MRKTVLMAAIAAASIAAPAMAAETLTYNSTPTDGWFYGNGNGYTPANTAVLGGILVPTGSRTPDQIYLRIHQRGELAPASDANGVYSFALGTTPINFDWGIDQSGGTLTDSLITLTNLLTGATFSYNPLLTADNVTANGSTQNSFQLNWAGIGFDPMINNTYSINLAAGGHSLTTFAQVGTGAGAIPEPATWAMMLIGFAGIGYTMRRSRLASRNLAQVA